MGKKNIRIIGKKKISLPLTGQIVLTPNGWVNFKTSVSGVTLSKCRSYIPNGMKIIHVGNIGDVVKTERWEDKSVIKGKGTRVLNKSTIKLRHNMIFCDYI